MASPTASPDMEEPARREASVPRRRLGGAAVVRACVLGLLLVGSFVVADTYGLPDVSSLRAEVEKTGAAGWVVFVAGYAGVALLPAPKAVLTALGGSLFGLWTGAALSLIGALLGAWVAFEVGRWLGRDVVDRLTRGRLARVDAALSDHGLGAIVAARLVPVLPFTVINYACGVSGVRRRDYVAGSAIGMVPGTLAYAAFGAWGTEPSGLVVTGGALVVLVLLGGLWGRYLLGRSSVPSPPSGPASDPGAASRSDDADGQRN